jgi:topoisomerase-4 subunit B
VEIKRDGQLFAIAFENGFLKEKLKVVGTVGQRNTGTTIRFWPDPKYFDSPRYSVRRLKHSLRAILYMMVHLNWTGTRPRPSRSTQRI